MTPMTYCEYGGAAYCLATQSSLTPMPLGEAVRCHQEREPYEAVIGDPAHPQYVVSLSKDHVVVEFYDDICRCYMDYQFDVTQSGRLFLSHALVRDFIGGSEEVENVKTFAFKEDGYIYMTDQDPQTKKIEERDLHSSVAENWDDYPQFGDYGRLCRSQRSADTD